MFHSMSGLQRDSIKYLCEEFRSNNYISEEDFTRYDVKRGLRNSNGTGVLSGLTSICNVVGYDETVPNAKVPADGRLIYRGIDVNDIVSGAAEGGRFMFEETAWLLLFGTLPTKKELEMFHSVLSDLRDLPEGFAEDMILKCPSPNVMNKMASSVLALYSYDTLAEDSSLENAMCQAISLLACMPTIMVYAYQVKRYVYEHRSMYVHQTKPELSIAENILRTVRSNKQFTDREAQLLDLCLTLHADHGGGNNSTFASRVLTSTGTDIYSSTSAAIGSLKGPRHGGANIKVMGMLDDIKQNVSDLGNDNEIKDYLGRILSRQAFDGSGLIYGLGHAVYTKSDPRALILRDNLRDTALDAGLQDDYLVLCAVERLGPEVMLERKGVRDICANVDLFSGLVYRSMGIPTDLFTPLFACARTAGWSAHRMEEQMFGNRIIRPAYKYIGEGLPYVPLEEREQNQ